MNQHTRPDIASSALITIDTQNDFTLNNSPAFISGTREIIPNIVCMLRAYRDKGLPIIHVIRLYLNDGSNVDLCRRESIESGRAIVAPDTTGAELVQELKPDSTVRLDSKALLSGEFQKIGGNEYIMYKPRWGAFYKTELEAFLHKLGAETLVFCGCNFPNCPRTSMYEASERDYRIVLAKDAISQLYPKGEEELESIGVSLLTSDEIASQLA